ncbi:MAG: hypothetical protein O7D86_13470 [Proteobacteria bacterium]|nr:hypothetical protein [Pseudomonadota bacterium]
MMTQSKTINIISKALIACVVTLGIQTTAFAAEPKNRVFFRGGFAQTEDNRAGQIFTDTAQGTATDDSGWYAGAGFDFLLSPDTLGLLPGVWTIAELTLEFRNVGSRTGATTACVLAAQALNSGLGTGTGIGGEFTAADAIGACAGGTTNFNMFSVSASPKLKFMEGSNFRPWVIPAGMEFVVISPPSDAANYLDIGIVSGAGIDYMLIPGITLGAEARYHWATGQTNGNTAIAGGDADANAWTVGVTLGIGFN